jgi:hypothetical protein
MFSILDFSSAFSSTILLGEGTGMITGEERFAFGAFSFYFGIILAGYWVVMLAIGS